VVCSPCSGHGFKFVPAVGDVVVDLADGGVSDPAWRLP
jgi:glycine/D-amino acid oxidase-like deaminating enzyme